MLNQERIKRMTKLASYESGEGKTYLPISKYYRSDYIGLALIKNFFLITLAFAIIFAVIMGYNSEYLLDNVNKIDIGPLIVKLVIGYIVLLIFYSFVTYIFHSVKYKKAKKSVQIYYKQLNKLNLMYERDERKSGISQNARRKNA